MSECLEGEPCNCSSDSMIPSLFAFIVIDPADGKEGVPAFFSPIHQAHLPMMGADIERAYSMLGIAGHMSNSTGQRIELVKFTERSHVRWINPSQ